MNGGYGHSFFRSMAMVITSGFELVAASFTLRHTRLAAASRCLTLFPPLADTQSGDLPPTAGAQVQNAAARRPRPTFGVRRMEGPTENAPPTERRGQLSCAGCAGPSTLQHQTDLRPQPERCKRRLHCSAATNWIAHKMVWRRFHQSGSGAGTQIHRLPERQPFDPQFFPPPI